MDIIFAILIVVVQIIVGYFLGFVAPYFLGIGNGWELVAIPIGIYGWCLGRGSGGSSPPGPF